MTVAHSPAGRLGPVFERCRSEGRAALIGYLPTGYPDVATSIDAMVAMSEGCDIIEVGVPYSDPGMDGPVIADGMVFTMSGFNGAANTGGNGNNVLLAFSVDGK